MVSRLRFCLVLPAVQSRVLVFGRHILLTRELAAATPGFYNLLEYY